MALAYIVGTATQGAADAFVQVAIPTALQGQTRLSFRVREIVIEQVTQLSIPGNSDVEVAISRRTKAAMPNLTDPDVIVKQKTAVRLNTSGAVVSPMIQRYTYEEDDDLILVEDPIYLILDSNGTTVVNTVVCRVGYTVETISEVDRLTLLTQSLVT